jgi:diacylglycerol kinase family enzyme
MKVSLFHNQKAGDNASLSWIKELIETSGHELIRVFDREAAIGELLDERTDLVVVAGGDGTVSSAARLLAGRPIPLAILPLGTANNIAKTLQGEATSEQLAASWDTAARRRLDLGCARGPWGERRFLEGAGIGLVPATITSIKTKPFDAEDVASKLARALNRYCEVLSCLEPRRVTLTVDGQEIAGDFILAEVMNTRSVGPNLVLASDADPSDGQFCVVTAGEEHRDELARYLHDRAEGREGSLALPAMPAREVEIQGLVDAHVDDEVVRASILEPISIRLEAAAVEFLLY